MADNRNEMVINEQTPVAMCTVGQLVGFLRAQGVMLNRTLNDDERGGESLVGPGGVRQPLAVVREGRKIYGLEGIMREFQCSKSTAQKYKKGIFKGIIAQQERKIVLDADKAWEIYRTVKPKKRTHRVNAETSVNA